MNKKQAKADGLEFTGIYNRFKEDTQERIKTERVLRPKSRIVMIAEDDGYSAYADDKYFAYGIIKEATLCINEHENIVTNLQKEYERDLVEAGQELMKNLLRKKYAQKILGDEQ